MPNFRMKGINDSRPGLEQVQTEYHKLWRQSMIQGVYALLRKPKTRKAQERQAQEYIYFFKSGLDYNKEGSFAWVCLILDLDPHYFRQGLIKIAQELKKRHPFNERSLIDHGLRKYGIKETQKRYFIDQETQRKNYERRRRRQRLQLIGKKGRPKKICRTMTT